MRWIGRTSPSPARAPSTARRRVLSRHSKYALYLRGFPTAPITGVRVVDCTFDGVANPNVLENVRGLELHGVTINGAEVKA